MTTPGSAAEAAWPHAPSCTCDACRAIHTRTAHPVGPDYCAECSRRLDRWVPWPCLPLVGARATLRDFADMLETAPSVQNQDAVVDAIRLLVGVTGA